MEIKDGILNNLLCMACLCIGRCIQEVKGERLRQYYLDLLMEIPLNNTKLPSPLLCWECEALLQRVVTFREQVKDSYRILQTYTSENFNEFLQSDVSRSPRLKVIQQNCINIPPEDTVKLEINEDKLNYKFSTSDVSDAEPEELHTVICDVERHKRRKNSHIDRRCMKLEERDPVCIQDEVKVELQLNDACLPIDNMKIETFDIKIEHMPREQRKKLNQNNSNELETIESNKQNGNDIKIEDNCESTDCKRVNSHSDEDIDDGIQVLEDIKKKTCKDTKYTKNQCYITLQLSYEQMQAERQALRKSENFVSSQHKCESCIITFNNEKSLRFHNEKRHLVSGKYMCSICHTNLSTVEEFSNHYKRHMKTYECSICNKRIPILKDIQQHLLTEHDIFIKKFTCAVCGVVSNSSATHRYHKDKYHSNKARIQCTDCDKTFSHRAGLMNHRLTFHEYQNKFPCTVCNKIFRWKTSLKRHLKKHTESAECRGSWFCVECGVSFSSSCSLQRHLRSSLKHVTSDQRRFICDHCGHRFTDKTKLRDHIEEKHLYRTYHCHICNKPSKNRVGLEQHIRTVHKGRPNNRMCHHCGKGFPTKVQLESHIRTHTGERPFMCEYCPTTFSQQSNLYKHHRQVHLNIKSKRYQMCKKRKDATQTDMAVFPLPVVHFMPENGFGI